MSELGDAYLRATGKRLSPLPNLLGRVVSAVSGAVAEV